MPYGEGHFEKVYAIEATCHAQSLYKIYSEVFRVLKPGGLFALYEWIMTDAYNPSDPYHKKLKADILVSRLSFSCVVFFCIFTHELRTQVVKRAESAVFLIGDLDL